MSGMRTRRSAAMLEKQVSGKPVEEEVLTGVPMMVEDEKMMPEKEIKIEPEEMEDHPGEANMHEIVSPKKEVRNEPEDEEEEVVRWDQMEPLLVKALPQAWTQFVCIDQNIYSDAVPTIPMMACNCQGGRRDCLDGCTNRDKKHECLSTCAATCRNQDLTRRNHQERFLYLSFGRPKGFEVRTNNIIREGEMIAEYVGEVIELAEYKRRLTTDYKEEVEQVSSYYAVSLSRNCNNNSMVINAHRRGNMARFFNHSCDPNCRLEERVAEGRPRVAIFASRNIEKGEELTFKHDRLWLEESERQNCKCDSKNCIGKRTPTRFKCPQCIRSFQHQKSLKKHITDDHSDKPKPRCTICKKSFSQKQALDRHMTSFHGGKKA